jgi:hypothetical protein
MSGSAGDGGSASAGGSAQLTRVGGTYTYTGSVTINASGVAGASGGVVHTFDVDVSGGEVFFQVIQRIDAAQLGYGGCQVNGRPFFSGSGFLGPGTHQITFDCAKGTGPGVPQLSGTYSWEFRIGPL